MTATTIPNTVEGMFPDRAPGITPQQYNYLCQGIDPSRVRQMQGQFHVEAWDVRRTLIRIFGFGGFDIESRYETLIKEIEYLPGTLVTKKWVNGKQQEVQNDATRWTVVYRVGLRLVIKDANGREITHVDDSATGDSVNQPSLGDAHDMALKTAHSQALKRCAVNLGDQFGLSLYNKGGTGGVVVRSLVAPGVAQQSAPTPMDAPPVLGGELDENAADEQSHEEAPPQQVPAQNGRRGKPNLAAKVGPDVALKTARQAAAEVDVSVLERVRAWAVEKGLDGADVRSAIGPEVDAFRLPDGPIVLGSWLAECIQRVGEEGISIEDQVRMITSGPVESVADGSGPEVAA